MAHELAHRPASIFGDRGAMVVGPWSWGHGGSQDETVLKTNVQVVHKATVGAYIKVKFVFFNRFNRCICCEETVIEITLN